MFDATTYETSGFCMKSDTNFFINCTKSTWQGISGECINYDTTVVIDTLNSPFFYTMATDFTVKGAAANFKTLGSLKYVPVGLLKHIENQSPLIFSKAGA